MQCNNQPKAIGTLPLQHLLRWQYKPKDRQYTSNSVTFDTDSVPIGVNNQCTGCISHRIKDFEGPLSKSGRSVKGFSGSWTTNVSIGTIVWKWDDIIPKSFYVPEGTVRLLSPQHWAHTQNDKVWNSGKQSHAILATKKIFNWNTTWALQQCCNVQPVSRLHPIFSLLSVKEPNRDTFIEAMQKEVRDQSENGNFSVIHRSKVPKGATTLPSVWQLKQKSDICTWQPSEEMERVTQCQWVAHAEGSSLYVHLCPSHIMELDKTVVNTSISPFLAHKIIRLFSCFSTSTGQKGTIHGDTKRFQDQWRKNGWLCSATTEECVWTETGWLHLEQIISW
jgi:hypothetical protein